MTPDVVFYAIGAVATLAGAIFGGLKIGRSARDAGESSPSEDAWEILSGMNNRLKDAEGKITSLESSLAAEKLHSSTQDGKLAGLQQALAGWSTWYVGLRTHWPSYRQGDQPPEPPIVIDTTPIPVREER